jgi:type IV secretory pathway TrbD component
VNLRVPWISGEMRVGFWFQITRSRAITGSPDSLPIASGLLPTSAANLGVDLWKSASSLWIIGILQQFF